MFYDTYMFFGWGTFIYPIFGGINMESLVEYLKPERGVKLETRTYYRDINDPCIIFGVGIGGTAGNGSSADNLTRSFVEKGYKVRLFSPRNSGKSTGYLTVDNYVSDLELVITNSAYNDEKKPFVVGHSMGGYALGRILAGENKVERAVLLSPLLNISEQNPEFLKEDRWKYFISHVLNFMGIPDQKFSDRKAAYSFLESLYSADECDVRMNIPTYILLSGRTNMGFKINDLEKFREKWQTLQCSNSRIELFSDQDHYFSDFRYAFGMRFFLNKETDKIVDKIDEFFRN